MACIVDLLTESARKHRQVKREGQVRSPMERHRRACKSIDEGTSPDPGPAQHQLGSHLRDPTRWENQGTAEEARTKQKCPKNKKGWKDPTYH